MAVVALYLGNQVDGEVTIGGVDSAHHTATVGNLVLQRRGRVQLCQDFGATESASALKVECAFFFGLCLTMTSSAPRERLEDGFLLGDMRVMTFHHKGET